MCNDHILLSAIFCPLSCPTHHIAHAELAPVHARAADNESHTDTNPHDRGLDHVQKVHTAGGRKAGVLLGKAFNESHIMAEQVHAANTGSKWFAG